MENLKLQADFILFAATLMKIKVPHALPRTQLNERGGGDPVRID